MANTRSPQQLQMLLLVALLAVGGILITRMWSSPARPSEPAVAEPQAGVAESQESSAGPQAESVGKEQDAVYAAEGARDPFETWLPKPAVQQGTETAQPEPTSEPSAPTLAPPSFALQGIVWDGPRPKAIIEHQIVGVGETVGGYLVKSITKDGVLLSGAQANWLLPRESGAVRLQQ